MNNLRHADDNVIKAENKNGLQVLINKKSVGWDQIQVLKKQKRWLSQAWTINTSPKNLLQAAEMQFKRQQTEKRTNEEVMKEAPLGEFIKIQNQKEAGNNLWTRSETR